MQNYFEIKFRCKIVFLAMFGVLCKTLMLNLQLELVWNKHKLLVLCLFNFMDNFILHVLCSCIVGNYA